MTRNETCPCFRRRNGGRCEPEGYGESVRVHCCGDIKFCELRAIFSEVLDNDNSKCGVYTGREDEESGRS